MLKSTVSPEERGAYILREPKGRPDIMLICETEDNSGIYKAADILAVQGYTARLVCLCDISVFQAQDEAYRQSVLPDTRVRDRIYELSSPSETAMAARRRILEALEENGCD